MDTGPRMIHAPSTGVPAALAVSRLQRLAWLFLAATALGLFCDHVAHAACAPPAGLSYEVSRIRRETMRESLALPYRRMDGCGAALV